MKAGSGSCCRCGIVTCNTSLLLCKLVNFSELLASIDNAPVLMSLFKVVDRIQLGFQTAVGILDSEAHPTPVSRTPAVVVNFWKPSLPYYNADN